MTFSIKNSEKDIGGDNGVLTDSTLCSEYPSSTQDILIWEVARHGHASDSINTVCGMLAEEMFQLLFTSQDPVLVLLKW